MTDISHAVRSATSTVFISSECGVLKKASVYLVKVVTPSPGGHSLNPFLALTEATDEVSIL